MALTKNLTLVYSQEYTQHTLLEPGVHVKVVEDEIDLDTVPLDGGALIKTLVVSGDPYIVYRLRDPSVEMFCPPIKLGDP